MGRFPVDLNRSPPTLLDESSSSYAENDSIVRANKTHKSFSFHSSPFFQMWFSIFGISPFETAICWSPSYRILWSLTLSLLSCLSNAIFRVGSALCVHFYPFSHFPNSPLATNVIIIVVVESSSEGLMLSQPSGRRTHKKKLFFLAAAAAAFFHRSPFAILAVWNIIFPFVQHFSNRRGPIDCDSSYEKNIK